MLQINFDQSDYTIIEGSATLCSPITLQFRQNQNPFTIMLSPVTVATAEAAGVGNFINADTIAPGSRATTGDANMYLSVCVCVCVCVCCVICGNRIGEKVGSDRAGRAFVNITRAASQH